MTKFTFSSSTDVKSWKHGRNSIGELRQMAIKKTVPTGYGRPLLTNNGQATSSLEGSPILKLPLTTTPGRDGKEHYGEKLRSTISAFRRNWAAKAWIYINVLSPPKHGFHRVWNYIV